MTDENSLAVNYLQQHNSVWVTVFCCDKENWSKLGIFQYTNIPRIGEWILLPDNDGSDDVGWEVKAVVYFPKYENYTEVAVHVSQISCRERIELLRQTSL